MSPDVHAKVRTLAKYNRRSYSAICNDLIIYSLKQERYQDLLEVAEEEGVKMKPVEDPRTRINQPMTLDKEDDSVVIEEAEKKEDAKLSEAQLMQVLEFMNKLNDKPNAIDKEAMVRATLKGAKTPPNKALDSSEDKGTK